MKRNAKLSAIALVSLCVCLLACLCVNAASLTDIDGHWAKEYIEYGVEKGYISGYQDGTFLPDKTVTRAEFSKMINSAVKLTAVGTAKAEFTDVASNDWFFNEVKKAENAGYITGYEDGTFRPNNSVTRQEAAVILSRIVLPISERVDVNTFSDGNSIDTWAEDSVSMIAAKGYIKGDENKNFLPKGALTRSQAAKLICEFVKNENIINKNQNVTDKTGDVIYSETLFTDDIVISVEDAESINVVFKNCRVLGNVYIKTTGASVEIENASLKALYVQADGVVVNADKSSSVNNTYVEYPVDIVGSVFKNVVLSGDDLLAGVVSLDGTFDKVELAGDAIISADNIKSLSVTNKVNASVMSGTIDVLAAESASKGSSITLAKNVAVKKAENKAAVTYTGAGTIETASNSVTGVVFDGVTVDKTEGKVADNGEGTGTTDDGFFSAVEITPENGKTNQAISVNTVFTFINAVYDKDGETLTADYVEKYFEIHKSSESGTQIAFEATVPTSGKKITLNPVANLAVSTKYYVVVPAGVLTYEDGSKNDKFVTNFKTAAATNSTGEEDEENEDEDEDASVTMSPKDNATNVSLSTSIKLTFSGTLKAYSSSKTFNSSYIEDEAIKIYEGSTSGDEVSFSASVSGKVVTLTPSRLLGDTEYFVVILGSKIKVGGSTLSKTTLSFTTEEGTPITISPESGSTNISTMPEITVSFAEPMLQINGEDDLTEDYIQDEVVLFRKTSATKTADEYQISYSVKDIADNGRSFVIVPDDELESGVTYYIVVQEESLIGKTTETENAKVTSSFKTASAMAPMFTPYDGKANVALGTEIRISFSDEIMTNETKAADRRAVDNDYLDELINGYENAKGTIVGKDRITLKRGTKKLDITATIDGDGKTIIITPEDALLEEKTYTVSIDAKVFYSASSTSKYNSKGSASFDTNIAMSPTITPKNEAEDIALTVNPTIKFSETILNNDGDELKSLYLKRSITFIDQYGEEVDFTASISGSTITVKPTDDLEGNVEYTLTLLEGTIQNEDGIFNSQKSVTFTTKVSNTIEITPASSTKYVTSPFVKPTVKFGTALYTIDGDEVDAEYAEEYIFITEGTKSSKADDAIPATIEISSDGRTFTLIPEDTLEFGTTYYVNVVSAKFLFADEETKNAAKNSSFRVIKEPALTKVSATSTAKNSAKITFTSNVSDSSDDELAMIVVEDENGEILKTQAITSTSSSSVTVKSLEADTEYTFYVYIVYDGEIRTEPTEVTVKTKA